MSRERATGGRTRYGAWHGGVRRRRRHASSTTVGVRDALIPYASGATSEGRGTTHE